MTKISVNNDKKWYESKTMWANILVLVAGILTSLSGELQSGSTLTIAGVANLILRAYTSSSISLK